MNRVVIVGGDAVAWLTALALHRAFRHRNLQITVLDTSVGDAAMGDAAGGVRWTLPSLRGMHAMIGIEEPELLRATGATFKLATEYSGFQGEGSRFLHAHGDIGNDIGAAPFYKFLIREFQAGKRGSPEDYSIAAIAAKLGRFARPMGDDSALTSSFTYGFHLDEAAYVAHLRAAGQRVGIARIEGSVIASDRTESGRVRALRLTDGRSVDADFFIHTTDSSVDTAERVDWSAWLPCDRMTFARAPADANPPPLTQIAASEAGWAWRVPLANATVTGNVYCSGFLDAPAGARESEPVVRFRNGRRRHFWEGNAVSLGAAALQLEPLAGANLHFAQIGIATLIELFPFDADSAVEGIEYNRIMAEHADALRDFTIAHYRVGKPRAGGFWDAARSAELPDTLARKLDLFRANGRIDVRDHETFEELDWAWLLLGAGEIPQALELQIATRLAAVNAGDVAALGTQIARLVASMPRHIDFLQRQRVPRT